MGAGASVDAQNQLVELLSTLADSTVTANRLSALNRLKGACDDQDKRNLILDKSMGLLVALKRVFAGSDTKEKQLAAECCWYLSRGDENCALSLCDPDLDLISCLVANISFEGSCKCIGNVSLYSSCHDYLLSRQLGLMSVWMTRTDEDVLRSLASFAKELKQSNYELFMSYGPVEHIVKVLRSTQTDKLLSKKTYSIVKFVTGIAFFPASAAILRASDVASEIRRIIKYDTDGYCRLETSIALCNLLGKDEASGSQASFLQQQPQTFDLLLRILFATLDKDVRSISAENLDLHFGSLSFRVLCSAIRTLSISDTNKPLLLKKNVLTALIRTLKLFSDNSPKLAIYDDGCEVDAGGGGNDESTAEVTIEALLQLSFNFEVDDKFREVYQHACPRGHDLIDILSVCAMDPRGKLSDEAKRNASALLKRLKPAVVAAPEPQSPTKAAKKHIMLSYSWAANKHLVVEVGKRLRELGHDVWRDEEGSSVVGPMSGDTDEKMAAAIEAAHTVVVFVSPQYKESANCRVEAKYAKQRQLTVPLKILYVMMSENYHTRSNPPVDGWLALNIGTDLWYPLWSDSMVGSTCQAIAGVLGGDGSSVTSTTPSAAPTAAPSSTTTTPTRATAAPAVDWDTAWSLISDTQNAVDEETLKGMLKKLGVDGVADVSVLDKEDLLELSQQLKKAKAKRFLTAVGL